jgi:sterol desaturase/sphingolipid hydroxylase (fatty acid hydroxylase superfamily)
VTAIDLDLAEKQHQFNAAMERYSTRAGYKLFNTAVSTGNISLQLWLFWQLRTVPTGAGGQVAALLISWLLADFVNGLVHMYMDSNDRYASLAGPLIANFHLHHRTPRYTPRSLPVVYFVETGFKVWLFPCLVIVSLLTQVDWLNPLLLHILVYTGILSSIAEVSHYLCHNSVSPLAMLLGDCRILLSKKHHALHHLQDNVSYAFLNGLTDPLINPIAKRFFTGYKQNTDLHFATYTVDGESR